MDNRRFAHDPCRHCGERYFAGHRCKTQQQFKCLEVEEGDEHECNVEEDEAVQQVDASNGEDVQKLVTLSLQSMVGIAAERSMRMKGKIGDT